MTAPPAVRSRLREATALGSRVGGAPAGVFFAPNPALRAKSSAGGAPGSTSSSHGGWEHEHRARVAFPPPLPSPRDLHAAARRHPGTGAPRCAPTLRSPPHGRRCLLARNLLVDGAAGTWDRRQHATISSPRWSGAEAPDWIEESIGCQLNEKSDGYNFGLVLVELLLRREPIFTIESGIKQNLSNYFLKELISRPIKEILAFTIREQAAEEEIGCVASLAVMCLKLREDRPTMKQLEMQLHTLQAKRSMSCTGPPENDQEMQLLPKPRMLHLGARVLSIC
ncbi:hypothetical protein EJB05_40790, partial [Eragrostis curvula]